MLKHPGFDETRVRRGSRVADARDMAHAAKIASSSYWLESSGPTAFPKLDNDISVDTAVVGGGITGLTAAYLLAAAGKSVALLERGRCAQAETGHTTAHLTMVTDMRLTDLVKRVGRSHAQAAWDAGLAAIAQIDAAVREHAIDCRFDWIDGYLHAPSQRTDGQPIDEQAQQFRQEAELAARPGVRCRVRARGAGDRHAGDPVSRSSAISSAAVPCRPGEGRRRVRGSHLRAHRGRRVRRKADVDHGQRPHRDSARDVVLATHNPLIGVSGLFSAALFQTKLALYTSYVIAGRVAKGQVPDALFWDTARSLSLRPAGSAARPRPGDLRR